MNGRDWVSAARSGKAGRSEPPVFDSDNASLQPKDGRKLKLSPAASGSVFSTYLDQQPARSASVRPSVRDGRLRKGTVDD